MAYSTISKPSLHFNTKLYSGNGSTQNITGVGFQPDWIWQKERDGTSYHVATDAVRGNTKQLFPNDPSANVTSSNYITSFDSDGFGQGQNNDTNESGKSYVAWNWKAGGGQGSSNTDGTINSTYTSPNPTAGFSIVNWTSDGSNNGTVGHGLGVEPKIVIYKRIDGSGPWYWAYKFIDGTLDLLVLNTTAAKTDSNLGTYGFTTSSTITNFGFGNTQQLIAYCFAEKKGYSKLGHYVGNNNVDGTFIYTGFKPAFFLIKGTDNTESWIMWDNKRRNGANQSFNPQDGRLLPNNAGVTEGSAKVDFLSNGFKFRETGAAWNGSGVNYIYMAFAEQPLVANVGSGVPATAR